MKHGKKLAPLTGALLLAATLAATPAYAATRPRPVTLTAASGCAAGLWTVDLRIQATSTRVLDVRQTSDMYDGALVATVTAGTFPVTVETRPGSSAQYVTYRVYPAGADPGRVDPLASVRVNDPVQANPQAGC